MQGANSSELYSIPFLHALGTWQQVGRCLCKMRQWARILEAECFVTGFGR